MSDRDLEIRQAVYRALIAEARMPRIDEVARAAGTTPAETRAAYARLAERHLLVIQPDGQSVRFAPPFSGVPTPHRVRVGPLEYFAPCAWDAFGIVSLLGGRGTVQSQCGQSQERFDLRIEAGGPEPSSWLYHCAVPARRWWEDIVYT